MNHADVTYMHACVIIEFKEIPAAPSLNLAQGQCELATDYVKKKNTLRLRYIRMYVCTFI